MRDFACQLRLPFSIWPEPVYDGPHTRNFRRRRDDKHLRALRDELLERQRGRCYRYARSPRCLGYGRLSLYYATDVGCMGLPGIAPGDPVLLCHPCFVSVRLHEEEAYGEDGC